MSGGVDFAVSDWAPVQRMKTATVDRMLVEHFLCSTHLGASTLTCRGKYIPVIPSVCLSVFGWRRVCMSIIKRTVYLV